MSADRDWLGEALEKGPYIDDAGFTEAVMRGLPGKRAVSRARFTVVPAFAAVGCAAAWELTDGWGALLAHAMDGVQADAGGAVAAVLAVAALATLLVTGALAAARGVA